MEFRRARPYFCAVPVVLTCFAFFLRPNASQRPEQLPDLDVLYIERTPRYPGYKPDYDMPGMQGVPLLVDPKTRKPLSAVQAAKIKRWPAPGERVTFTAHVQNRGNAPAHGWEYAWSIDGHLLAAGRVSEEQPVGSEVAVSQTWAWRKGRHTVKFTADPLYKLRDLSLSNNSREDATDAWSLIWAVDRSVYDQFNKLRNFTGSRSFEDWAQWHIDHMNHLFDISPVPWGFSNSSIDRPRIRCDRVVVVDNADNPWDRVLGEGIQPLDAGFDGGWSFGRREDCTEWAANVDWGLIHEWGHQLGLTDEYALDRPGFQNLAPDDNGDPLLIGHMSSQIGHMMHGHGPTTFSAECMAALMTQPERRRGYYGDYYYCIPKTNYLYIQDVQGKSVIGAKVDFWQDSENEYHGAPVFSGMTDNNGLFLFPNRSAPHVTTEKGYTQRDNPFGKINVVGPGDVFFIRIQARGHTEYAWMDIAEFNIAYWSGNSDRAVFTKRTHIPPLLALAPPKGLSARVNRETVVLRWQPVEGAKSYRIYHGAPDLYQFEPLKAPVAGTSYTYKLGPGALHRFVVTAVNADGIESGFSNTAGAMHFGQPWGIVVTLDGKRLIRDASYGQAVLQKPDGNTVGLVGSVHYHFEGSYDIALDPRGRILSAKWGDGYNPKQGFKVQNPDLTLAFEHLEPEGVQPGQVRKPMGIASDSKGNIYIADTGNDRVQQFTPEGKFLSIIGERDLSQPMKVAFDKEDNMYVADCGHDRIAMFAHDGTTDFKLVKKFSGIREPVSVIADERGRVFASAKREGGVSMFNSDGKPAWKYEGEPDEPLLGPRGLAFDLKGNLLIVDEAALRVISVKPRP